MENYWIKISFKKTWNKMKTPTILIFLICFIIVLGITNHIVFVMASSVCEKSEVKPFRYESQGLFGILNKIETTEENRDGYAKLCITTGNPKYFSLLKNINYLLSLG